MKKITSIAIAIFITSSLVAKERMIELESLKINRTGMGNVVIVKQNECYVTVLKPIMDLGLVLAKEVDLNLSKSSFVEAYHTTNRGNGYLAVYEIHPNLGVHCILAVRGYAKDLFKNSKVEAQYIDLNSDGYKDVIIKGETGGVDSGIYQPFRRVFIWNQTNNATQGAITEGYYEEDVEKRIGFVEFDDFYEYKSLTKRVDENRVNEP